MGGYGCGQRGWRTRTGVAAPILERTPCLDPTHLDHKLGIMREGSHAHSLTWFDESWEAGSNRQRILVDYKGKVGNQPTAVTLELMWSNKGDHTVIRAWKDGAGQLSKHGWRWWMECPWCGDRRTRLYAVEWQWKCRICHDLRYACQRNMPAQVSMEMPGKRLMGPEWRKREPSWLPSEYPTPADSRWRVEQRANLQ